MLQSLKPNKLTSKAFPEVLLLCYTSDSYTLLPLEAATVHDYILSKESLFATLKFTGPLYTYTLTYELAPLITLINNCLCTHGFSWFVQ